jgi:putative adhesin
MPSNPSNPTAREDTDMPSFDTPEPISATIDLSIGAVRIIAADRANTVVEVRPSDPSDDDVKAARLSRVEYLHGRLTVKAPRVRAWLTTRSGGSVDITVELPAGSSVEGTAGMGDFDADGALGSCRIKTGAGRIRLDRAAAVELTTGAGDISVDHVTGRAEVTAGSGDLRLRRLDAGAVIKNSNGATWVGEAGGDVQLNAANGSIAVDLAQAGVRAMSANGAVRLGEVVRGDVTLETQVGELEVGIREGTAAWLDVRSRFGRVHNALDAADAPEPSAETVQVRARTSVGNVVIRRP